MRSNNDFVVQSLETHLFFARIMKEHSFFLQIAFMSKDSNYIEQADSFRREFDKLLEDVVSLSNGVVSSDVLDSGEVITPYTSRAEMVSAFYSGVRIPIEITRDEANLEGNTLMTISPMLYHRVVSLNQWAMDLISALIKFKSKILTNVIASQMFTANYPLLIDHIMREANLYLKMIQRLQNKEDINIEKEALEQEFFWNRIMAEHSKFIRGLLDPTEKELFDTANNFGNEFDLLTVEAKAAMDKTIPAAKVTEDSLKATIAIRDFKAQGTQGLIEGKIKSIIIPLLGDHTLREANHFLRLLKTFEK